MKKKAFLFLLLLMGSLASFSQRKLSTEEFASMLRDSAGFQLVDVRTPAEYREAHLINSENIDFKNPDFASRIEKLDKTRPVMVYCLAGSRSADAAKVLLDSGFSRVYDMYGGYIKWSSEGKPAAGKSVAKDGPKAHLALASGEFSRLLDTDKPVLIDFTAEWCKPCIEMLPTIKKLEKEYEGRAVIKVIDYDANKSLSIDQGVYYLPALLLFKNGKLVWQKEGKLSEAGFRNLLNSYL